MNVYTYNIPVSYVAQDNETYIAKKEFLFKSCENLVDIDCDSLWNGNHCAQDIDYSNPFTDSDTLYFQYAYNPDTIKTIIVQLVNSETEEIINPSGVITTEQGTDSNGTSFFNIIVDCSAIDVDCIFLNTYFFDCEVDEEGSEYLDCYDPKVGAGTPSYEARLQCYQSLCEGEYTTITTESYKRVKCEGTIRIHGYYPSHDCNGNYYGEFTGGVTNSFIPSIRVRGEVFWTGTNVEEVLTDRTRTKARRVDTYNLRTEMIPPYVVQQVAICFSSQYLYVESPENGDNLYKKSVALQKNREEGRMWIINTELLIECNEQNFTCD